MIKKIKDSKHLFECQLDFVLEPSTSSAPFASSSIAKPLGGQCQKLTETPVGEALVRLALNEIVSEQAAAASEGNENTFRRELPFEPMNYGKKKRRQLPFEPLNYGKRSISSSGNKQPSGLPFDSILIGKKGLPFETLNYGKRAAYIPVDGYIMGKRED